jgi:hypothetical protein
VRQVLGFLGWVCVGAITAAAMLSVISALWPAFLLILGVGIAAALQLSDHSQHPATGWGFLIGAAALPFALGGADSRIGALLCAVALAGTAVTVVWCRYTQPTPEPVRARSRRSH